MKRAFTLVELLVVISVISMIGSIILVTTASVQAKGRDAKRIQQVRQIDLATRLYIESTGYAPTLGGRCAVMTGGNTPSENQAKACFAISTAVSGDQATAWTDFTTDLVNGGFISQIPGDPCGSGCVSGSLFPIGYTYVAPLAMQYFCNTDPSCTDTLSQLASSYQLYAPLELQSAPSNPSSGTPYPAPGSGGNPPPETIDSPTNFAATKECAPYATLNDSQSFQLLFYLFAYKTVSGERVYSPYTHVYFNENQPSICGLYTLQLTWNTVSEAEGYRIVIGHDDHFGYNGLHYIDIPSNAYGPGQYYYAMPHNLNDPTLLNPMVPTLPVPPPLAPPNSD